MLDTAVTKMHGTFNDFVVIDERARALTDLPALARAICDRRGGVGADGLIVISPSAHGDARMRIFNPDGGEAEMCGNGMRCAVRYLSELGEGEHFRMETQAGIVVADVTQRGEVYQVRLNVGVPQVQTCPLPLQDAIAVRVGNPHVVIFRETLDDFELTSAGKAMPDVNVHAAVVLDRHAVEAKHYERGVGLTYACGTGSVACAAAAIDRGLCETPVRVHVPGGVLDVEWDGAHDAYLTGPAVRVFDARLREIHAVPV